jgi:hypothetical protein
VASDTGADSMVRRYRPATQFVEVEDEGVGIDVDDPKCDHFFRIIQLRSPANAPVTGRLTGSITMNRAIARACLPEGWRIIGYWPRNESTPV